MQENNSAATIEQVFQKDAFTLSVGEAPTENLAGCCSISWCVHPPIGNLKNEIIIDKFNFS
jgi:hypothetical protein